MSARQRVRANLFNVVFSRAMLTSEVLDGLDAVNKAADVPTFGDAVDAGHDLIENRMSALGGVDRTLGLNVVTDRPVDLAQ